MAFRYDRGSLRSPVVLSDGSLRVDAVISRAGVFEYREPDGRITKEYRPAEEVFSKKSMDSFIGMAVVNNHPYSEPDGLITVENRSRLGKGFVLEGVRRDGNELVATLVITDPDLIREMKAGKTAVSCGYEQDLVVRSGTAPDGSRFDAVQTNIRGNHVAIVDVARAGDIARVRMDSATMIAGEPARENVMNLEQALAALAVANVKIGELTARADAADKVASDAKTRLDAVTAERDAAKEKAEKAEKARLDGEANMMERARARLALEDAGTAHLRTDAEDKPDFSKKSDHEIRVAVTEKLTGKKMDGKSEAYVQARFDAAIESAGEAAKAVEDVREALEDTTRLDASGDAASKARDAMIARNNNAWNKSQKGAN